MWKPRNSRKSSSLMIFLKVEHHVISPVPQLLEDGSFPEVSSAAFNLQGSSMHLCFYLDSLIWPFIQPGTVDLSVQTPSAMCLRHPVPCTLPFLILSSPLVPDTLILFRFECSFSLCLLQSLIGTFQGSAFGIHLLLWFLHNFRTFSILFM